ncbi:major Facilitator Superfamily protein [Neorickettsia helminthoeca str. Oregon]|uniref:Lysosomal dipeptide transporter MFSD1 n=1 Tax=Neorickettsia helminthoeca str. Oregon TaxID=1286528 RepID=X5HMM7_9RICK|nr:MFS transporter [Neorickettsia helminthoeca]AHX11730.1 major Facilitator Superfamily protein [Neorickettsia helminthoeca str. Oregon]
MKNTLAWLVATLFFTYQYILRVLPNIVVDDVIQRFSISSAVVGQVTGLYYVAYTLLHIPIGIMLDRMAPRKVIFVGALLVVLSMVPLVYTSSVTLLVIGKLLLGGASSVGVLGLLRVVRSSFPAEKFSLIFGISIFIALIGAMYGGQPLGYCIHTFGWYTTFTTILIVGLVIAFSAYLFIPDKCSTSKAPPVKETLSELFSLRRWLVISLIGGLMVGPLQGFADGWATKFFSVVYPGIGASMAGFLPSLILLGLAFGAPLLGLITVRFGRYYTILTACSFLMFVGFQLMFTGQVSLNFLFVILVVVGAASSYQTLVIHLASSMVPDRCMGTAAACANMIIMAFGYFFHATIGMLVGNGIADPVRIITGLSVIKYCLAVSTLALPLFYKLCVAGRK